MLLKYDVDPASILRCKATFRRSPEQIEKLVCRLKNGGVDKILSYMIADSYPERYLYFVFKSKYMSFDRDLIILFYQFHLE